ncbi:hypothetical protein SNK05_011625 [Fusarium graminearum]
MSSLNSFQQAILNNSREDAFSGPEELSSNSNSPSSTAFTTDGRNSPSGSISATTEAGRLSVTSVSAACLACALDETTPTESRNAPVHRLVGPKHQV